MRTAKFLLLTDVSGGSAQAQVWVEGLFSRGNGVIYGRGQSQSGPLRVGTSIGAGSGYQDPGSGYPDLGPAFGNWATPGRGFLGLTLADPTDDTGSRHFYGFADITVNDDYSITLNAFAYENVSGQPSRRASRRLRRCPSLRAIC